MTGWFIVILFAVGFAVWLSWPRKRGMPQSERAINQTALPYHGVSIRPTKDSCGSARNLQDQRFLAREAPRLPLPNCDAAVCQCRYSHFEDRREGDRRSLHALQRGLSSGPGNMEHRSGSDRRRSLGFPSHAI